MRQARTGSLTETIVTHAHGGALQRQQSRCPQCERLLQARPRVARTVDTMVGSIELARPYCYGRACHHGSYPLDAALGLTTGRTQLEVQKAAARVAAEVPYDEAQTLLSQLTGVGVGSERMHTFTQQATEGLTVLDGAPSREDMAQRLAQVAAGRPRRPVLVLGIDGAFVATRPESARARRPGRRRQRARRASWRGPWRDAKGFRFYVMDGDRIVHLLSWPQGQSAEELGEALRHVKEADIIPQDTVRMCVVADGASWRGKQGLALFPNARQVLDYYHCTEYIHTVAKAQYGTSRQALEWAERTMTRLSLGKIGYGLGGLRRMPATSAEAEKAIANSLTYLEKHRGRTHYRQLRRGGYPLGSGGRESANTFICPVRLKRSGAWWYERNSNPMLALRCAKYNGTFEAVFARYQQRLRTV